MQKWFRMRGFKLHLKCFDFQLNTFFMGSILPAVLNYISVYVWSSKYFAYVPPLLQ